MKNTVTINLDYYNELRDFKRNITSGKCVVIKKYPFTNYPEETFYYTKENMIQDFATEIKELKLDLRIERKEYDKLKASCISIKEIKSMSIFKFLRLKFSDK